LAKLADFLKLSVLARSEDFSYHFKLLDIIDGTAQNKLSPDG
jgi:hypothetical protein